LSVESCGSGFYSSAAEGLLMQLVPWVRHACSTHRAGSALAMYRSLPDDQLPQMQVVGCVQSSYLQAREGTRAAIVVKIVDVESLKKTEGRVLWTS